LLFGFDDQSVFEVFDWIGITSLNFIKQCQKSTDYFDELLKLSKIKFHPDRNRGSTDKLLQITQIESYLRDYCFKAYECEHPIAAKFFIADKLYQFVTGKFSQPSSVVLSKTC
jgi:hypothetical protein